MQRPARPPSHADLIRRMAPTGKVRVVVDFRSEIEAHAYLECQTCTLESGLVSFLIGTADNGFYKCPYCGYELAAATAKHIIERTEKPLEDLRRYTGLMIYSKQKKASKWAWLTSWLGWNGRSKDPKSLPHP